MASIFAKRGKLWMGWYEDGPDGKRIHPQVPLDLNDTQKNRKIAAVIKKQKEVELLYRKKTYYQKIEVDDAINEFMKSKEDRADRTKNIYYYALGNLKDIKNIKYVDDITKDTISAIKLKMVKAQKSKATIATYLKHIKIFFNYLIEQKLITENPVKKIEYYHNKNIRLLNDDQLDQIFEHFKEKNLKHYHFLRLLYLTGLRISEAVNLRWDDIDYHQRVIKIRNIKAKREELLPLTNDMIELFDEIGRGAGLIFNYKNTDSLKTIKRELVKLGSYTFHDFRRTFGTKWASVLKPFELKKIMRHKDIRTTDKHYVNMEINEIGNKMEVVAKWLLNEKKSVEKGTKIGSNEEPPKLKLLKFSPKTNFI